MTTGVGLTVGHSVSTAVVTASGTDVRTIEHPSVLFTAPDGTVQLGDPGTESTGSVQDFLARVGEPAGIEYAGTLTRAEDLVATAMFCLFREAAEGLTGTVKVTATHPSDWAADTVTKLRESLDYMGLQEATLVAESVALAASDESPAHGAALLAAGLALTPDDTQADTESIPVIAPPVHTAYSAVADVPAVVAAPVVAGSAADPSVATGPAAVPTGFTPPVPAAKRTTRRPLIFVGAAAAALIAIGGAVAFALTDTGSTAVPAIQDAQTASLLPSSTTTAVKAPVVFPTAVSEEVPATTDVAPPPYTAVEPTPVATTSQFVPPPPPPAVITLPPVTIVTTTTAPTTVTTAPTTTTPTTTETSTESVTTTTTTTTVAGAAE
ncbi:hypothetical protein [Rhodococcus sp. USK13]|uniref:hypothetical protein n=1 Tax=Rhodococcus sp. USK13 TaxID=2806442 RepID=UPI001BCAE8AD|nr:hypothetical protein [Rhodococcus sp. USK13]